MISFFLMWISSAIEKMIQLLIYSILIPAKECNNEKEMVVLIKMKMIFRQ